MVDKAALIVIGALFAVALILFMITEVKMSMEFRGMRPPREERKKPSE